MCSKSPNVDTWLVERESQEGHVGRRVGDSHLSWRGLGDKSHPEW